MKRRHCGVCKLGFSKGRRVELLEGGALRGVVVCQPWRLRELIRYMLRLDPRDYMRPLYLRALEGRPQTRRKRKAG